MFMPNCSVISLSQLSPLVTLNFFFYACESVSALQMGVFVSVSRSFLGVTAYAALFLWLAPHCVSVSRFVVTALPGLSAPFYIHWVSSSCIRLMINSWGLTSISEHEAIHLSTSFPAVTGSMARQQLFTRQVKACCNETSGERISSHYSFTLIEAQMCDYRSHVAIISFLRNLHSVLCGGYCQLPSEQKARIPLPHTFPSIYYG